MPLPLLSFLRLYNFYNFTRNFLDMSRILLRVVPRSQSQRLLSSLTSFGVKPEQKTRELIDRVIRVDHSGELAADRIYAGQMAVLGRTDVGPTIQVEHIDLKKKSSFFVYD